MLIARVITAVGLALLLVVGAWSTSRGSADVHATLCLASGVSSPAGAAPAADAADGATAVDVLTSEVGICLLAVFCGVGLVLLFRLLRGHGSRPLGTRVPRRVSASRAGPSSFVSTLTLTQLSISRT